MRRGIDGLDGSTSSAAGRPFCVTLHEWTALVDSTDTLPAGAHLTPATRPCMGEGRCNPPRPHARKLLDTRMDLVLRLS